MIINKATCRSYRTVDGFEGYQVGSDGTVWSNKSGEWRQKKQVEQHGFMVVGLTKEKGRGTARQVHMIVARAFLGQPDGPDGKWVRHLDGDRKNNHRDNLAWGLKPQYTKECTKCGETKSRVEFNGRTERGGRLNSWCRQCRAAHARNRRDSMPRDELRFEQWRDNIRKNYGLTPGQWFDIAQSQDWKCKICGSAKSDEGKNLHVDHCHETGEIRGLLCHGCNTSLGGFKHDPELLRRAADYLEG